MVSQKEWQTEGHLKLDIPPEVWRRVRYKVIYRLGESTMIAWCRKYRVKGAELRLIGVLTDTSDRVQGITLIKRITSRREVRLVNIQTTIIPLELEEIPYHGRE